MIQQLQIEFPTIARGEWLKTICAHQRNASEGQFRGKQLLVTIDKNIDTTMFEPIHLVTLACLLNKYGKPGVWKQ